MVYGLTKLLSRIVFKMLMDVRVEGAEHVPLTGGAIVIGNHHSALDPHLLLWALPRRACWYVKATSFEPRIWNWYWRQLGARPVLSGGDNREARQHGLRAIRAGHLLVILPEGDVSPPGQLYPFRGGFLKLAVTEGVPVVPTIIVGSEHGLRNSWHPTRLTDFLPRRAKIRVEFLPPLRLENPMLDRELFDAQLVSVRRLVSDRADELRNREGLRCREPEGLMDYSYHS